MNVLLVVGARPNFMKVAPILREMRAFPDRFVTRLVHTGQHYDENMSRVFFDELGMPEPDVNLEVGSGSHAWQTAQVMMRFEPMLDDFQPDLVVVVGDVNSTLACALVSSKRGVAVAHVEAGLRSFDRGMPEEINRLLTDQISDLLFTHSAEANENLLREGIPAEKIHLVGNVMIDTLVALRPQAEQRWPALREKYRLDRYILVTLHRPANVDQPGPLGEILSALNAAASSCPVLFPVHPRGRSSIEALKLENRHPDFQMIEPLGYLDFLALQMHARLVVTDSGGVQEETTFLGIRCLTVRPNTERRVTLTAGTNELVAANRAKLLLAMQRRLAGPAGGAEPPELWDGQAARRIVGILQAWQPRAHESCRAADRATG